MRARLSAYLQVAPLTAVFVGFFVLPITIVIMVSFFDYRAYQLLIPTFTLQSYADVFAASVTYRTYLITLRLCLTSPISNFCLYSCGFLVHPL